ncbi:MAG TPA: PIN domain-containing protein, partial [Acidothermaceae bacterium]
HHLRSRLTGSGVEQLVYTPQYFAISQSAGSDPAIYSKVTAEWQVLVEVIDELLVAVKDLISRWVHDGLYVVLDTNKLVQTIESFEEIDWRANLNVSIGLADVIHLVVPLVVIDELDRLKRTPKRSEARRALKAIEARVSAPGQRVGLQRRDPYLPVTFEVLAEPLGHERLSNNDSEIVARATWLRDLGLNVAVATWDTGTRFRASGEGLRVVQLPDELELP